MASGTVHSLQSAMCGVPEPGSTLTKLICFSAIHRCAVIRSRTSKRQTYQISSRGGSPHRARCDDWQALLCQGMKEPIWTNCRGIARHEAPHNSPKWACSWQYSCIVIRAQPKILEFWDGGTIDIPRSDLSQPASGKPPFGFSLDASKVCLLLFPFRQTSPPRFPVCCPGHGWRAAKALGLPPL